MSTSSPWTVMLSTCLFMLIFFRWAILTQKVGHIDLVFDGSLVGLYMQGYKSLCAVVMICSTLVNIQTDMRPDTDPHTVTHRLHFDQLIWKAQVVELKIPENYIFTVWLLDWPDNGCTLCCKLLGVVVAKARDLHEIDAIGWICLKLLCFRDIVFCCRA